MSSFSERAAAEWGGYVETIGGWAYHHPIVTTALLALVFGPLAWAVLLDILENIANLTSRRGEK